MARERRGPKNKFVVNEELLTEIETLSGRGLTQEDIYHYYCVSSSCWYGYVRKHPEIAERVKRGKSKTKSFVGGKLMEAIKAGNIAAIIFYMKCNGMSEKSSLEVKTEGDERPPIVIVLPENQMDAANTYQQYMKKKG